MAKKRGIYKGWGLMPNPHIKLTHYSPHRLDYMAGFAMSVIPLPLWILTLGLNFWWFYVLLMFSLAILDFLVVFGYSILQKEPKK
jgi:hypothetical protein